jgi:hypothetical protein
VPFRQTARRTSSFAAIRLPVISSVKIPSEIGAEISRRQGFGRGLTGGDLCAGGVNNFVHRDGQMALVINAFPVADQ